MDGARNGLLRAVGKALFRRPSAAMLVAVVALLISLGAPAYATQAIRSVLFANRAGNAVKVDGIRASHTPRRNQLLALDSHGRFPASVGALGPRGPQGVPGTTGPAGQAGTQGDRGANGAPGTALAYAIIRYGLNDEGTKTEWRIDDGLSKKLDNDVNFTKPDGTVGVFCVHALPFTVSNMVATPGPFGANEPFDVQVDTARQGHSLNACPTNSAAAIYVTDPAKKTLEDPPDPSDTIFFELN